MGTVDLSTAERPIRAQVGGSDQERANRFRSRFPPAARRHAYLRNRVLAPHREPPVNPERTAVTDPAALTAEFKRLATEMGADIVGIAAIDPRLLFTQAGEFRHRYAIVIGMAMSYENMIDIGPPSQDEVHRVYFRIDELGLRLAQQIAAYGYSASMQPNEGEVPLVAMAWLAGLGELGKHGSLISPELGSSLRLGAVTTDLPLAPDRPVDHGIDEVCLKCGVCTRYCPGAAIRTEKQRVNGVERWQVDTPACEPYFHRLYGCKICLMVCPLNGRGRFGDEFKRAAKALTRARTASALLELIESRHDMHYEDFEEGGGGPRTP